MDGLGFTVTVLLPLSMLVIKIGTMFATWGLVMAATRLVQALTRYINGRTANESTSPRR